MIATFEQIEGGLWGLLVGDAVGVPYEFHSPSEIPDHEAIGMIPPPDFKRSYSHVPLGTWSDDGAQALCLAASLIEHPHLDLADFAARLLRWSTDGYMAVDERVFDIGIQTGAALNRLSAGAAPADSGLNGERNNGNGSLMRCLPLALLHRGDDRSLTALAHTQSLVTHAHPRSQACCALYALWARFEIQGEPDPWNAAVASLRSIYLPSSVYQTELDHILAHVGANGSGYVVDSLHSARKACSARSYQDVIRSAIALGNDTDTTACIAGGIAGIRHGKSGIPSAWITGFRGTEILLPLLDQIRRAMFGT